MINLKQKTQHRLPSWCRDYTDVQHIILIFGHQIDYLSKTTSRCNTSKLCWSLQNRKLLRKWFRIEQTLHGRWRLIEMNMNILGKKSKFVPTSIQLLSHLWEIYFGTSTHKYEINSSKNVFLKILIAGMFSA